jgi:ketosteroid isomerase-like protein
MTTDRHAELERMLDRAAIEECLLRYTRGIDRHDVDLVTSAFHPDALDTHGTFEGGPVDVARWANEQHGLRWVGHQHYITNTSVDLDGDVAHTDTYYLIVLRRRDGTGADIMGGRYVDRLERRAQGWRIARRVVTAEWISEWGAGRPTMQGLLEAYEPPTWDREDISYQRPLTPASMQRTVADDFQQSQATTS